MKMRIIWGLLIAAMLLGLFACGDQPEIEDETTTESTTTTAETTEDEPPEIIDPPEPVGDYINPLTGLPSWEDYSGVRPVAFMFNNIRVALPQSGISMADVVYEAEAEGGITRIVGIFCDIGGVEKIGTIRSTRPVFINIAQTYDAVLIFCGYSPAAGTMLKTYRDHIDGLTDGFDTFWRDAERRKTAGYEHSLYTNDERILKEINRQKMRMTVDTARQSAYSFTDEGFIPENAGAANRVTLTYWSAYKPYFEYDAEQGEYLRFSYNAPHIDEANDNIQLAFKNVIVLNVTSRAIDSEGRRRFDDIGSGAGIYVTNGGWIPIRWSKAGMTAPLMLTAEDGQQLKINPGRVFIGFVNGMGNWAVE